MPNTRNIFSEWKDIVPDRRYRILKTRKCIACTKFNRDSPKFNFKIYIILNFWRWSPGVDTKLLIGQIFYLGLRSENIKFWICLLYQKSRILNFKNRYFHFWDLYQKYNRLKPCIDPYNITTKFLRLYLKNNRRIYILKLILGESR